MSNSTGQINVSNMPTSVAGSLPAQGSNLKKTIFVHLSGSLSGLEMQGDQGAVWSVIPGKQGQVFGVSGDGQTASHQLQGAVLRKVSLLEHRSTFPVPLGITIPGLPHDEKVDTGQGYVYTVLPHSKISAPQQIYACDSSAEEGAAWRAEYPSYNRENIDKQGVLEVANCPYVFVHEKHPVISLLSHNAELIGCNIHEQPKIDNEWYKVTRQVLKACCDTLRANVLNNVQVNDLNLFKIKAERLNASQWDCVMDQAILFQDFQHDPMWSPEELQAKTAQHTERFLSTPYTYMARLQLEYEIPPAA